MCTEDGREGIGEGKEEVIIERERREAIEAEENERAAEVERIERSEVSLEASRAAGEGKK
jgi:hypothetical protein